MSHKTKRTLWVVLLTLVSLACGTINIGIVENDGADSAAPTQVQQPASEGVADPAETSQPTEIPESIEPTAEDDYAYLWQEYRDARYGYGVALPAHWIVNPTPTEGLDGAMTTTSYDEAFYLAHTTKGWWSDNVVPEGAIKMDFAGMPDPTPELDLASAIEKMYSQSDTTVVLATEPAWYNGHEAVLVTTASPNNLEETFTSVAFRLPNDKILLATAFWGEAFASADVQAILNSFALQGEPVILPTIAPHPPLSDAPVEAGIPSRAAPPRGPWPGWGRSSACPRAAATMISCCSGPRGQANSASAAAPLKSNRNCSSCGIKRALKRMCTCGGSSPAGWPITTTAA